MEKGNHKMTEKIMQGIHAHIQDLSGFDQIEIVENKPLARMLYANVDVGQAVPPELYQAVAEVLAFVYHLQGKV